MSFFQIMYEGHPEGSVEEFIALTTDSIRSEMIDDPDPDGDHRPGLTYS